MNILFLLAFAFADAQTDSESLMNSFNTIPTGRTNIGFVTKAEKSAEFEESEKIRLFECTQKKVNCTVDKEESIKK